MKAANEATSTDKPVTVTFDTLTAAKKLRDTGFNESQAEAIVTTVNRAMSETLATKTDLQSANMDLEAQIAATRTDVNQVRTDLEAQIAALRADVNQVKTDLEAQITTTRTDVNQVRTDLEAQIAATKAELTAQIAATRAELTAQIQATNSRIDELQHSVDTLQDRIVLRLGGVMVTMTVLLMAIGPFYIRWVMSIIGAG